MFAYNFDSGENFCWKFFSRELFFVDSEKKNAKIAKNKTRKNIVPHGIQLQKVQIGQLLLDTHMITLQLRIK